MNEQTTIPGRIENGVVVLEGNSLLPEGARVVVLYTSSSSKETSSKLSTVHRPDILPIFDYESVPDIALTNDQIADILDYEDASA